MNILVIGKGGREHALARAASRSALCDKLYAIPGNPGMAEIAQCVSGISETDADGLVAFAKDHDIDLVIIGPEAVLDAAVADAFMEAGIRVFGPTKAAAKVESSKQFAKDLMKKYSIPTADYEVFDDYDSAAAYVEKMGAPIVIKENGLKAGKGVTVASTVEEALDALKIAFEIEGNRVVIEECLNGFEFSLIALTNGTTVVPLECAQDHKRVGDNDEGPNTGGMGSYSPVKMITEDMINETMDSIMKPMAKALADEGVPFTGFLYGGLMVTDKGIKTIEFNARFGDPEAEVILIRLESDFIEAILSVMNNEEPELIWSDQTAHGVVLASEGYPASSTKNAVIEIDDDFDGELFHMGTAMKDGKLVTDGGRVLMAVNLADTLQEAKDKTYQDLEKIHCDKLFYRHDIGNKDLEG